MLKQVVSTSVFLFLSTTSVMAWGSVGHSVVAELAERKLNSVAAGEVDKLLGANISLASIASWADDFKFGPGGEKTKRWHYIDIGFGANDTNWRDECALTGQGDCLPEALKREIAALGDKGSSVFARAAALKFVVHLAGDMTQPLHCTERNGDGGGNKVTVDFAGNGPDGKPLMTADAKPLHQIVSFHQLWDETLISSHTYSFGAYVDELELTVAPFVASATYSGPGDIDEWVKECHKVGVRAYNLLPGGASPVAVGADYQSKVQPIVDQQLATAGVRLAAILNATLKAQ